MPSSLSRRALLGHAAALPLLPWALPLAAQATPPARPIFVLNSLDASVSVIDPVSFAEIKRIPTGKEPHHLYLTPDEKSLIVANAAGHSLTFVDPTTGEVQRVVRDIPDPYHLRFSPDMKWFVTASNTGRNSKSSSKLSPLGDSKRSMSTSGVSLGLMSSRRPLKPSASRPCFQR